MKISRKIALIANNKQKTHFRKAMGCARFAYNWGLAEWQRRYKAGEKVSYHELKKEFNAIKREQFPFVLEVTKYAVQQPFRNLQKAFDKFFADLKKGMVSYPQFKCKKDNFGSFYIGGDQVKLSDINLNSKNLKNLPHNQNLKYQYLKVPNLGWVKMSERLKEDYKIYSVVISQKGDKFYASFNMEVTEGQYDELHSTKVSPIENTAVGIDLGVKSALVLSEGIAIDNPRHQDKYLQKVKTISRQLSKRSHAKTKQERLSGVKKSANYKKLSLRLNKAQSKIANVRQDFIHKVSSVLTSHYRYIMLEDLNVKGMVRNRRLARVISDVAFGEIGRCLSYKAQYRGSFIAKADRFYPSSKTCSVCGHIKQELKLGERIYSCSECGAKIDRDYNASLNLKNLLVSNKQIGRVSSEFTPVDLTALLASFARNGIATSKVETGIQHKS